MNVKRLASIALLLLFTNIICGQDTDNAITRKYAENSFRDGDYVFALENYLELLKLDKNNVYLNYKIGICYTETNIDKKAAIKHLEFVVNHNNYPPSSFYYLGRAYMYNYRFTESVEAFYDYKMVGVNKQFLLETDRLITNCYNALEYINQPKNVTFEVLNSTVNSEFDDFYPFINSTEDLLIFSSNRTYVKDFEDYISNVFYSENSKNIWKTAKPLPTNTFDNEQIVGTTPLADKIMVYADGDYFTNDIKMINRKGSKFSNAKIGEIPPELNTDDIEMGASLSADGNTLFFASDREGGRGKMDIYFAKKNEKGVWSEIKNIGTTINTEYDENFPTLSHDGKKLYFASKGHRGNIGGYDLFESTYIDSLNMWTNPITLGFPINTPNDNTTISFSADGQSAYISADRNEGLGNLDIYKIKFGDSQAPPLFIIGSVFVGNESNSVPYSEDFLKAYATIYDMNGNIFAQYEVGSDGGQFFATLFAGTYKLEVKFSGDKDGYSETITLTEENASAGLMKNIYLKPIN